eukprot:CAMPEP_0170175874 /NCGR_PEP_ID=MMETSP0040_2-20121228/8870_1 /TAXON_ID=641309 /ORGANISM="Lotharella oceanica, Strain CCMP622" /LENGTH=92 /DNA_ID=CAMNT_0010418007 /DNA_START=134 /DNA_END=411 /DNA_ORIENTATION=-
MTTMMMALPEKAGHHVARVVREIKAKGDNSLPPAFTFVLLEAAATASPTAVSVGNDATARSWGGEQQAEAASDEARRFGENNNTDAASACCS